MARTNPVQTIPEAIMILYYLGRAIAMFGQGVLWGLGFGIAFRVLGVC